MTLAELKMKFQGKCKINSQGTLIANGEDTIFLNLDLAEATLVTGAGIKHPAP